MGTGGGNVPLVMETPKAYRICSMESNAMKSGNPDSGFYEAETSRTIDCKGGNPGCNQGGMVILDKSPAYAIQGNMIGRAEKNGPNGKGVNKDVSFTLTALDRHGVAYAIGRDNVTAWDECYNLMTVDYIVRRFTPLECGRLQGFPDDWVDGVSDEDPDKKAVQFWMDAWAEWWALVGRAKGIKRPKAEKAVRRWLKSPASDTELYRMWGNGIALPCAQYVLEGIAAILSVTESDTRKG